MRGLKSDRFLRRFGGSLKPKRKGKILIIEGVKSEIIRERVDESDPKEEVSVAGKSPNHPDSGSSAVNPGESLPTQPTRNRDRVDSKSEGETKT